MSPSKPSPIQARRPRAGSARDLARTRLSLLVLAAALPALLGLSGCGDHAVRPQLLPSKSLGVDLDGRQVSTAQYRGKVLLVDFWAPWAKPCQMQMVELDSLKAQYGDRLSIVLVDPHDPPDRILRMLKEHPVRHLVTLDQDGTAMASFTNSKGVPTVLLLDTCGAVRSELRGYMRGGFEGFRTEVEKLVGFPAKVRSKEAA